MNNFYLNMQKASWQKCDCFIINGRYTTPKNGKIETYVLYVKDQIFNYLPPKKENIEKLIDFAKKHYEFNSFSIEEGINIAVITFNNLDVGLKDNFRLE